MATQTQLQQNSSDFKTWARIAQATLLGIIAIASTVSFFILFSRVQDAQPASTFYPTVPVAMSMFMIPLVFSARRAPISTAILAVGLLLISAIILVGETFIIGLTFPWLGVVLHVIGIAAVVFTLMQVRRVRDER